MPFHCSRKCTTRRAALFFPADLLRSPAVSPVKAPPRRSNLLAFLVCSAVFVGVCLNVFAPDEFGLTQALRKVCLGICLGCGTDLLRPRGVYIPVQLAHVLARWRSSTRVHRRGTGMSQLPEVSKNLIFIRFCIGSPEFGRSRRMQALTAQEAYYYWPHQLVV